MLMRPFGLWPCDPYPLGAYAYVPGSANFWRAVTKMALEARREKALDNARQARVD